MLFAPVAVVDALLAVLLAPRCAVTYCTAAGTSPRAVGGAQVPQGIAPTA